MYTSIIKIPTLLLCDSKHIQCRRDEKATVGRRVWRAPEPGVACYDDTTLTTPLEHSMNDPTPNVDPKNKGRVIYEEADIGSGEKSPGQQETEEMIRQIPPLPANRQSDDAGRKEGEQAREGGNRQA
jgi:hypothetical protein